MSARAATARAPATIANVAVGFDVLGFAIDALGDSVTVVREEGNEALTVVVESIAGADGEIPRGSEDNTASVALLAMARDLELRGRFRVRIDKGIPLSSGLGGSAASAVGAVAAANALLDAPLPRERLLPWALAGEAAASGAPHADNVAPCLFGGLTATLPAAPPGTAAGPPPEVVPIDLPDGLVCVVARPHLRVDTKDARGTLAATVPLAEHVAQSARLAAFVVACVRGDYELLRRSMHDTLIEPQRAARIPGFADAKQHALRAGAIGCSIAGSGPSVFAWAPAGAVATAVQDALQSALQSALQGELTGPGVAVDAFVTSFARGGVQVVVESGDA